MTLDEWIDKVLSEALSLMLLYEYAVRVRRFSRNDSTVLEITIRDIDGHTIEFHRDYDVFDANLPNIMSDIAEELKL